jgi:4-carboxymuconolactone decarboxylase
VKLGIAIGALAEGAGRSNGRKVRAVGMSGEDICQTALLAISTAGFPAAIAAMAWIEEVLVAE